MSLILSYKLLSRYSIDGKKTLMLDLKVSSANIIAINVTIHTNNKFNKLILFSSFLSFC